MELIRKMAGKIRRNGMLAGNDLLSGLGLNERLFRNSTGSRMIIYHGLCQDDPTRFNALYLEVKTFEKHLRFFKKYFQVVSLDDYYAGRYDKDKFAICMTFDDGFVNNYRYVLPLIEQYQVPVAFYITGIREAGYNILWNDFLSRAQKYGPRSFRYGDEQFHLNKNGNYVTENGGKSLRDWSLTKDFQWKTTLMEELGAMFADERKQEEEEYWLQMTEEEIRRLSESPFATIGSHGYYHNDLSEIPVEKAEEEMVRSRNFLQNLIQKPVDSIAFPYGTYSREVVKKAKAAGYNKILAMNFLFSEDQTDPTMRERFTVNPFISVNNQMLAIIRGNYIS